MKLKNLYKREYRIWKALRARCNAPCYSNSTYQKKGIKCCRRWQSFEHFISDMGKCPEGYSIDRIDNNKGYEPDNCRWADNELQGSNQTSNRYIQYNCWVFSMNIWAKIAEIDYYKFYNRFRKGWDFERAIFTNTKFSEDKMITVPNEFEIYNKYQEWVDDGKIPPVQLPLSTAFPVINYFNIDKKK